MDKLCDVLNRCGKRFEEATRKAETMADSVWHHRKSFPDVFVIERVCSSQSMLSYFHYQYGMCQGIVLRCEMEFWV